MKYTFCLLFIFTAIIGMMANSRATDVCSGVRDSVAEDAVKRFCQYFNERDSVAVKSWAVPQPMYEQMLVRLQEKAVTCLTKFDLTYNTRQVVDEFNRSCESVAYRLDSIGPVKITPLEGCGGVQYKKVDARAYFRKGDAPYVELPLSLVLMAGEKGEYFLMMQILNYKILQNEQ